MGISKGSERTAAATEDALRRCVSAIESGRADEAERIARDVLAGNAQHAPALHLLGCALLALARPREAVEPLQQAARDGSDPRVETHLAIALRGSGQTAAALACLERAATRQPPFAPAFKELGALLRTLRRFAEAETVLKRGLELAPSMLDLVILLGGVFLDRADAANAKVAFARALAQAPGHPQAQLGFGIALQYEGEFLRAAERFRLVLAREPNFLRARLNLGYCLIELGEWDKGVACLRAVVQASPQLYGAVLRTLSGSGRGQFWLRRSAAAEFLGLGENG